jgi:hypothetical protein
MRRLSSFSSASCLALLLVTAARADEAIARRIIENGVKALGQKAGAARYQAGICTATGTVQLNGRTIACNIRVVTQPPYQQRLSVEGSGVKMTRVLNDHKGWITSNGVVRELTREEVREYRDTLYAERVSTLVPVLKEKGFTLSLLGEAKIDGTPAVGIKVGRKGEHDVKLYFGRSSGLLLKVEVLVKDGKSMRTQETFLRDYEVIGGVRRPRNVVTKRDKKDHTAWEIKEFKPLEKRLPDSEFGRPAPEKAVEPRP